MIYIGNGETYQRFGQNGINYTRAHHLIYVHWHKVDCVNLRGRLYLNFDEPDEFGTFIFRNTGFNSIRTLAARLVYYHAASGKLLSCLPLQLTLWSKSIKQSYQTPTYYMNLILRDGMNLQDAISSTKQTDEQGKQSGFYQEALD